MNRRHLRGMIAALAVSCLLAFLTGSPAWAGPVRFTDSSGCQVVLEGPPQRVVSLVPGLTEILFRLGAGPVVRGITYHDAWSAEASGKQILGGFFSPSPALIKKIQPDVIFLSSLHDNIRRAYTGTKTALVQLDASSLADIYRNIRLLGVMFDRRDEAELLVREIKSDLDLVSRKLAGIPLEKRQRVIRFMGRDEVMTPGDDSFQTEYIKAAGGLPPLLGKKGAVVPVTLAEWEKFDPQVIYACNMDSEAIRRLLDRPGWRDVEAVKNGRIVYFPCDLTCRASARAGYFISGLSHAIYEKDFAAPGSQVEPDAPVSASSVSVDLDYVKTARVVKSLIGDVVCKTLAVEFERPMTALSTLEGFRSDLTAVGNHYVAPPGWSRLGGTDVKDITAEAARVIGLDPARTAMMVTGADMDNLSVSQASFEEMKVWALVTAGVRSNALRMSADSGDYYEPGTINIIIMTNRSLSDRAMARAVISATEAKTAALQDLDVRSFAKPVEYQATGTGTDNMIILRGEGAPLDLTGGHCKMGELIARAVYGGVRQAVAGQNGLTAPRSIFQRLEERRLSLHEFARQLEPNDQTLAARLCSGLEHLLLEPVFAGFLESALAMDDSWRRGLISDLAAWQNQCLRIGAEAAGMEPDEFAGQVDLDGQPPLFTALRTLAAGVRAEMADYPHSAGSHDNERCHACVQ